jgi:formylglycine-generating enzyme required for sulfatase activity
MSRQQDWVLATEVEGRTRHFAAEALPVSIGGEPDADLHLDGVHGVVQIGLLDDVFFIQPGRNTRNLRVDGVPVGGSRRLEHGEVVALDRARLTCKIVDGRLTVSIDARVTAGDTAPPDLDELARSPSGGSTDIAITPIAFTPGAGAVRNAGAARPSKTTLAVAAGFAVLGILGWFAFTAKSVELRFEPRAEQVSLPGTVFQLRLGDRYLLRSGTHRVAAERAGYYPLDTEVAVGQAPDQSIELSFTKLPGLVTFTSEPEAGAEVVLDGRPIGRTPLADFEVRPGLHRLEFSAERYLPQVLELDVEGGGERQRLVASLTPNWAPVMLTSEPAGAEVFVDGAPSGATPAELEVTAGEREIEVRLAGYNAWRDRIQVVAAQPQELPPVALVQADGRVELASTPSEASVNVDGEFRGRTPLTLRLRPGRAHRITLTKPGHDTVTRELSVAADSGRQLQIELTAQYGEVDVRSEPPGAEIWVDGQQAGVTPSRLTLSALSHDIEVRLDGYAPVSDEITPRPGYAQVLPFELEMLDESSGSGYASKIRTSLGQELELLPAGQFTMGSSRREEGRRSNEVLRPVKLSRAFYLSVHEVTNAEFRAFFKDHDSGEFGDLSLNDDVQPVARVTWEEAARFLNWLSIQDGLQPVYEERQGTWLAVRPLRNGYRLPTEAEWAWAARFAGRESAPVYAWGDQIAPPDRSGNYADVSAVQILPITLVTYNDGFPVAAPVGSFEPNPVGLRDLGGNVAEWVQDFYSVDTSPSSELVTDPLGPAAGRSHVVRGASWRSATQSDLRLAARGNVLDQREDVGFRIARNLE